MSPINNNQFNNSRYHNNRYDNRRCLWVFFWTLIGAFVTPGQAESPRFLSADLLPEIEVAGKRVKIHTQGLYATESDYIVTGRVDTPPRHPVLMKFSRRDLSQVQQLDLTLGGEDLAPLNHPGGFDCDPQGVFWIPLSTSHRSGPTTLLGIRLVDGKLPKSVDEITRRFELADHIGAICCLADGRLLGANWDTQLVYVIDPVAGKMVETIRSEDFFGGPHEIQLAVQDWKLDPSSKQIIAGGIDKSKRRRPTDSNAVIAQVDPQKREITSWRRMTPRSDVARPLTNEGLAIRTGRLFLLPEDIGRGAKVLQFEWGTD